MTEPRDNDGGRPTERAAPGQSRPSAVSPRAMTTARKARMVGIVMASTMALWLGAQVLGGRLGLPVRYVFLLDMAALAAFVWALIVVWQIRRERNAD